MRSKLLSASRWLLWLVLAWVALRGAVEIVSPPKPSPTVTALPVPPLVDREGARTFADFFVREYLTWDAAFGKDDRAARLAPFLARYLDSRGGLNLAGAVGSQRVLEARVWKLAVITDQTARVTVVADVVTTATGGAGIATSRRLALSVPVAVAGSGYVIYDYPAFIPLPQPGTLDEYPYSGTRVSDTPAEVKELLTGFFRAYAEGSRVAISYFLVPGARVTGLEGAFQFRELGGVELREATGGFTAHTEIVLVDPATGTAYRQRYLVHLVKKDRWYIQDIEQKGAWTE